MKPRVVLLGVLIIVLGAATAYGIHYAADHYLANSSSSKDCTIKGTNHQVTIENDKVSTSHVNALLCDTLTVVNRDNRLRLIAFGNHDHHIAYDNVTEKILGQNQSLTITLDKTGTYKFHDHDQEEVTTTFTVN